MADKGLFLRIVPWNGGTRKVLFCDITFELVESATSAEAGLKFFMRLPEYDAEFVDCATDSDKELPAISHFRVPLYY